MIAEEFPVEFASDHRDAYVLERKAWHSVPCFELTNLRTRRTTKQPLLNSGRTPDYLVCLAGYMKVSWGQPIEAYEDLNHKHSSSLPARIFKAMGLRMLGMLVSAESGVTIHWWTPGVRYR